MEPEQQDTHIPQSEQVQFSWTVQGQIEESIEAANQFDNQGSRSF